MNAAQTLRLQLAGGVHWRFVRDLLKRRPLRRGLAECLCVALCVFARVCPVQKAVVRETCAHSIAQFNAILDFQHLLDQHEAPMRNGDCSDNGIGQFRHAELRDPAMHEHSVPLAEHSLRNNLLKCPIQHVPHPVFRH